MLESVAVSVGIASSTLKVVLVRLFVCDIVVFVLCFLISSSGVITVRVGIFSSTPLVIVVCLFLGAFVNVVQFVFCWSSSVSVWLLVWCRVFVAVDMGVGSSLIPVSRLCLCYLDLVVLLGDEFVAS